MNNNLQTLCYFLISWINVFAIIFRYIPIEFGVTIAILGLISNPLMPWNKKKVIDEYEKGFADGVKVGENTPEHLKEVTTPASSQQ